MRLLIHKFSFVAFLLVFLLQEDAFSQADTAIVAPGANLVLIDSNFSFTEGPAVDKQGNIFFTDQPNDKIWEYDVNGKLSLFLNHTRRSNGMYFDAKGNLIACADEQEQLISITPSGKISVVAEGYNGHTLNGPNDLWIDPKGGIYITDPYFQRDYWKRQSPDAALGGEKVYYLPPGKKQFIRVDGATKKPNGIIGTVDGKTLYVADMGDWKTYKYDINPDGTLTNKRLFANEASDGMTTDDIGNIYFSNNGVTVYNSAGIKIKHIDVPEKWVGNICIGGKERNILFITASKSVYTIRLQVKGVE